MKAEPRRWRPRLTLEAWRAKVEPRACWTEGEGGLADQGRAGGTEDQGKAGRKKEPGGARGMRRIM